MLLLKRKKKEIELLCINLSEYIYFDLTFQPFGISTMKKLFIFIFRHIFNFFFFRKVCVYNVN